MFDASLLHRATELVAFFRAHNLTIVTAESCTGGLVAGLLTEVAGASAVLERGYVTYSNAAKAEALEVPTTVLTRHGAVSEETAVAMARGALVRSPAGVALAVTGIAGPGGGSATKPVGLVHLAALKRGGQPIHVRRTFGDIGRAAVRRASLLEAMELLHRAAL